MSNPKDTKKEILDLAENLLLDRGYNGFSYKDISVALGIKTASIHYHYPRKTDLGVEIVERAVKRFDKWAQSIESGNPDYSIRLEAFCLTFTTFTSKDQVCLGGALQTDYKTLPEDLQKKSCEFVSCVFLWLDQLLKDGREAGAFRFPGEAGDQAVLILAALQGSVQMDRVSAKTSYPSAMRQILLSVSPGRQAKQSTVNRSNRDC